MVNTEIQLIIFFAAKDGEALYSQQKTRPGVNYGLGHELLIAKFRLKLEKVGERPVPMRVARGPLGIPLPTMLWPKTLCGVSAGT